MSTVGFDMSFARSLDDDYIFNIVTPQGQDPKYGLSVAINILGAVMRREVGNTGTVRLLSTGSKEDVVTGYTYIAYQLLQSLNAFGSNSGMLTEDSNITADNLSLHVRYNTVRYNYPTLQMAPQWVSLHDLRNFALAGYFLYLKQLMAQEGHNFKFTTKNISDQLHKLISSGLVLSTNSDDYQLAEFLRNHVLPGNYSY